MWIPYIFLNMFMMLMVLLFCKFCQFSFARITIIFGFIYIDIILCDYAKLIFTSSNFLADSKWFLWMQLLSEHSNKQQFYLIFQSLFPSPPCLSPSPSLMLTGLVSWTMLAAHEESRHVCLLPDVGGKTSSVSQKSTVLVARGFLCLFWKCT